MNGRYDVAVVGASGMVGEAMMSILEERKFPIRNIYPLGKRTFSGFHVAIQWRVRGNRTSVRI